MTIQRYLPALDGWRGVSILLVLAAHAGMPGMPGGLGVTIFFFISGLLITGQLLDERRQHGRVDLVRFYWRRVLRLWPASTAFVLVAGTAFVGLGGTMRPWAWFAALFYVANYAQLATHLFDTNVSGLPHPFVILWSLAIEEQFYLVWPALLLGLACLRGRAPIAAALLGCAVACLAWRLHLAPLCAQSHDACGPHGDDWIGKSTGTRADSLAFGALAAVLLRSHLSGWLAGVLRTPAPVAGAAVLLLITALVRDAAFRDTWRYTLQGMAILVLVPASMFSTGALGAALSRPLLVAIGRLSYGLYLWHWLALMLATRIASGGIAFDAAFVTLTTALVLASWFAIERPIIAWRRRAGSSASAAILPDHHRRRAPEPALAG